LLDRIGFQGIPSSKSELSLVKNVKKRIDQSKKWKPHALGTPGLKRRGEGGLGRRGFQVGMSRLAQGSIEVSDGIKGGGNL